MMFWKSLFGGLALKIVIPISLVIGVMLVGLSFMTTQTTFSRLRKQAQETRDDKLKSLAEIYRLTQKKSAAPDEFANRLKNEKILTAGFFAVTDENNKVLYKSATAPDDLLAQITANADAAQFGDWNVARENIEGSSDKIIGAFAENDSQIVDQISQIRTSIFLSIPLVVLLLSVLIFLIVYRAIRHLGRVIEVADAVSHGDLSANIAVKSRDEIGQLQEAMQRMVEYLREKAQISNQIAAGNLTVKVPVRSEKDEFGLALQNMLANLLRLVQSQGERDQLQSSIMKLLNEVADVANGDLTAEAEVTPNATGAIADAFNYMIAELRSIIHRVMEASLQVSSSANQIRTTTERLAEGSEVQSEQITATSAAIEDMAASIQDVSQNAALSARVASESLANATNGTQAVQNNITAMNRIRQQVQETAKRIKRLGERSQEIGEIVKLIDDIADRTSTLALNASLQAASAGPAGRGFAVVAEEVERLAERSTHATKQIAGLTKSIQMETKEVVASMEETIQEVVGGSHLANEAGQALKEIEQVSSRLSELIQFISYAAQQQARGSEEIARSMIDISKITELVSAESRQTETSAKDLVNLVNQLGSSVSTFKLPKTKEIPSLLAPAAIAAESSFYVN